VTAVDAVPGLHRFTATFSQRLKTPTLMRWFLAAVHLLALGVGLGAVWARGRALRGELDVAGLRRAFAADNWWALAAVLWIASGLARAFGGWEKGSAYYLHNHFFWGKMALLGVILVLEVKPIVTLMRWRIQMKQGRQPDTRAAPALATISFLQAVLVILMVILATGMARGYGVPHP